MITIKVVANTFISSHIYHFFFVVRTIKICSFSNIQLYNTIFLSIVTVPYVRYLELIHHEPVDSSVSANPQTLTTTTLLSVVIRMNSISKVFKIAERKG